MPTEAERAYATWDPETQTSIKFNSENNKQTLPDKLAERLISEFPKMFGYSLVQLRMARDENVQALANVAKEPVPPEPEPPKHPTIKAMKKVEKTYPSKCLTPKRAPRKLKKEVKT